MPEDQAISWGGMRTACLNDVCRLSRFRRWTRRLAFNLADQALVSGGHFVLNLLLIRWLSPADYGVFAVSLALFLIVAGIHNALVLEPMSIVGPTRYGGAPAVYVRASFRVNATVSIALGAFLLLVSGVAEALRSPLAPPLRALAVATPLLLTCWFLRRTCYLRTQPGLAFWSSLQYVVVLWCGLEAARRLGWLSPSAAFISMALASGAANLMLGITLTDRGRNDSVPEPTAAFREHWRYARWFLGSTAAYWLANSLYVPLVGALVGLPEAGAYRAMESLLLPMSQALTGFGLLLLPALARQGRACGPVWLRGAAVNISLGVGLLVAAYVLGVVHLGPRLVEFIYGSAYYAKYLSLIPYLGGALVLRAVADTGFGTAAKASGHPQIVFWSALASSCVTLAAGIGLARTRGISGAAMGWLLSAAANCLVTVTLFRRTGK